VRQVRKHQTWCVYKAPSSKLIPAYPAVGVLPHFGYAGENGIPETPNFLVLLALLATRTGAPAAGSVTVLIEDATAHRTVATLPNVPRVECAIVDTLEGGTLVLKGEAQGGFNRHYPACPLGVASMPATDVPVMRGVFAGNSRYAASTSNPVGMFWTPGNIHHLSQPRAPITSVPCPGNPPHAPIIIHPPC
jgi:hypothetical protein